MKYGSLEKVIKRFITGDTDYGYTTPNGSLYVEKGVLFSYGSHFPLAIHLGRYQLINADKYSNSTGKHQSMTIRACYNPVEIPFSALSSAINNNIYRVNNGYEFNPYTLNENLDIIDHADDVWTTKTRRNSKGELEEYQHHLLGGCVFSFKDRYFFSGIDETGKGNHIYFLTELTKPALSVEDALHSMKPQEVIEAENNNLKVLRQGEWFFIPADFSNKDLSSAKILKGAYLTKDNTEGHHTASEVMFFEGRQYCKGIVKHSTGDHKQLKLYEDIKDKKWYLASHNVQIKSFNAVGNVD